MVVYYMDIACTHTSEGYWGILDQDGMEYWPLNVQKSPSCHKLMLDSLKVAYQHEQRLAKDFLCMYNRTVESVALVPK